MKKAPIGGGAAIGRGRRTMMLQWLHREARWLAMADAGAIMRDHGRRGLL